MDSAGTNGRKFPSMTTEALKIAVVDYQMGINPNQKYMTEAQVSEIVAKMTQEVKDRMSGKSKVYKVPQVGWK